MKQRMLLNSFTDAKIVVAAQQALPAELESTRVWSYTLQRNLPWRAALLPCSLVALRFPGLGAQGGGEHWNACGVSLCLLRTIQTR